MTVDLGILRPFAKNAKVAHIDINPVEIGQDYICGYL